MPRVVLPRLEPLSLNPTKEEARQKFCRYVLRLAEFNGLKVLPRGKQKRWWHRRSIEHPMTLWDKLERKHETLESEG